MRLVKRVGMGILLGGWLGLPFAGNAMAEGNTQGTASDGRVAKAAWEQRVLARGPTTHAGPEQARADQQRATRQTAARQNPSSTTSTASRSAQLERASAEDRIVLASLPPDEVYDSIQMDVESYSLDPVGNDGYYDDCGDGCDCGSGCGDYDGCGDGCGYCGGCGMAGCGGCGMAGCGVRSAWWARDLSLHAGAHGFKGPFDQGRNGNFGLHEGVDFGGPLGGPWGWGYQVGFTAVQSNFSGDRTVGQLRSADRDQFFFTSGVFRRATCGGFQWGVAFDLLRDTYYTNADIKQLRTEVGYVYPGGRVEIGYWGAYGVGDDQILSDESNTVLEATDLFAFYYRRHFCGGGEGRLWAGFTGNDDGLLGADLRIPLGGSWVIENRVSYLIPGEGSEAGGQDNESWGLSIRLVWYLGQSARCAQQSPYRPLLGVADNSLMMVDCVSQQ